MGKTAIEWSDETWNPVTGCSKVSPGCDHCYAETLSLRFGWSKKPWTLENAAENVVLRPERLEQPLKWRRPRMVFVNSMSDLFHENVGFDYILKVFSVMQKAERHTFQVLTKRPRRMAQFISLHEPIYGTAPNIWLGTSIESWRFNWRADVLREIPAAVRFISAEPLLDTLLPAKDPGEGFPWHPAVVEYERRRHRNLDLTGIDWLIVGGESGIGARPMDPEWARELRRYCLAQRGFPEGGADLRPGANPPGTTAFFFKQWGGRTPKAGGRLLDGCEWNEMPRPKRAERVA